MNIKYIIKKDIEQALINIGLKIYCEPLITSSKKIELGNYQLSNLIKISNTNNIKTYDLFKKIFFFIKTKNIYEKITFSSPGFINFFINKNWLSKELEKLFKSSRLGIKHVFPKQTIVIDYSSPNIAKEMHIGHLRSTIIGDATVRTLEFLGHNVIRINHIGDWGTQFGMLIAYLKYKKLEEKLKKNQISLKEIEHFYCKSKKNMN